MKVVHILSKDIGGAARAALRINSALKKIGVESDILVLEKKRKSDTYAILDSKIKKICFKGVRRLYQQKLKKNNLEGKFYEASLGIDITKQDIVMSADIINLHWVNDGMISFCSLNKLLNKGKKIVWTMHDMFSFTAGCYYDFGCGQYEGGCKNCLLANKNTSLIKMIEGDYQKKYKIYREKNITFVGCSKWITECAKKSKLTKGKKVITIPNTIDISIFNPRNRYDAIQEFGISTHKKIILFGAVSADSDLRKGFLYLKKALSLIDTSKFIAIIFGNNNSIENIVEGLETISIGNIYSDKKLAKLYSIADVFVAPSVQENLSNAVMEALACGTPVAAFNIGGMPDMISHKVNGYLANPYNIVSLKEGIEWAAENKVKISDLCVDKIKNTFSMERIGRMYLDCYLDIEKR